MAAANRDFYYTRKPIPLNELNHELHHIPSHTFQIIELDKRNFLGVHNFSLRRCTEALLFGALADGQSICCRVTDFKPHVYVKHTQDTEECLYNDLEKRNNVIQRIVRGQERFHFSSFNIQSLMSEDEMEEQFFIHSQLVEKTIVFTASEKPSQFFKVTFPTEDDRQSFIKDVRWGNLAGISECDLHNANITYEQQYITYSHHKPCQWCFVPPINAIANEAQRISSCNVECVAEMSEVEPQPKLVTVVAPIILLSFDIEVAARPNVFPQPEHDPIICIAAQVLRYGQKHDQYRKTSIVFTQRSERPDEWFGQEITSEMGSSYRTCFFSNEQQMCHAFIKFVRDVDADIITGYNIANFDIPYIIKRGMYINKPVGSVQHPSNPLKRLNSSYSNRTPQLPDSIFCNWSKLIGYKCSLQTSTFSSTQKGTKEYCMAIIPGRVQFDLLPVIQSSVMLKSYRLGFVSNKYLGKTKIDLPHYVISTKFKTDPEVVEDYCKWDAELCTLIDEKQQFLLGYIQMSVVTGATLSILVYRGEQQKAITQLLPEFDAQNLILPVKQRAAENDKKQKFQGAFVLDPIVGFHPGVFPVCLDYTSLYPSIMMQYNVCYVSAILPENIPTCGYSPDQYVVAPDTGCAFLLPSVKQGILPSILDKLLTERRCVKAKMNGCDPETLQYAIYNRLQLALKVSANSLYGFCGAPTGIMPLIILSSSVTAFGRTLLMKSKSLVEEMGCTVYYGDTDSIMVHIPGSTDVESAFEKGREMEKYLNDRMPPKVQFKVEEIMKNPLFIQKKHYACEMYTSPTRSELLLKGIDCVKRDKLPIVSNTMRNYLKLLINHTDAERAYKLVMCMVARVKRGQVSITDIVLIKGLSKPIREYTQPSPPAHVTAARRAFARDSNYECSANSRIPFVFVKPNSGDSKVCDVSEDPGYVIDHNLPIDYEKYTRDVLKAVERIITVVHGIDGFNNIKRQVSSLRPVRNQAAWHNFQAQSQSTQSMFDHLVKCANPECAQFIKNPGMCSGCVDTPAHSAFRAEKLHDLEEAQAKDTKCWDVCRGCQNGDIETAKLCVARDCPNYYERQLSSIRTRHLQVEYDLTK